MASEFGFDRSSHASRREAYSVTYDELSKRATIHVRGTQFVLDGPYENYAAAMRAAQEFLNRTGLKL